jgi:hypothetical protein
VVIVYGIPGSGKSRFLVEIGNQAILDAIDPTLVLAVTFNNHHIMTDLDSTFFQTASPDMNHLPLCLRLLHAYAGVDNAENFDAWYRRIRQALNSVDGLGFSRLTVLSVINFLRAQYCSAGTEPHTLCRVLCLVDEVLMPWNDGKSDFDQTWSMMRSIYSLQGEENKFAVVFSTLAHLGNPSDTIDSTQRSVHRPQLMSLEQDPATALIRKFIGTFHSFFSNFQLSTDELVARILASVSSLPRALRFAFDAFEEAQKSQKHLSLREILESVAAMLSAKYGLVKDFNSNLLIAAVLGVRVEDSCAQTADSLFRRGAASSFDPATGILQLNPVQLLSYSIQYSKKKCNEDADQYVADNLRRICNAPNSNRNIFEQVHHAQLHLRFHHFFRSRDRDNNVDVFSLFPGMRILKGSRHLLNARIDFEIDISRPIYMFSTIPSPLHLISFGRHFLCVPDDPRFPAIDAILFLRLSGHSTRSQASRCWLAVGIQDKWSIAGDQDARVSKLASDEQMFRCMMGQRGWLAESLLFVAVQRQDLPDYFVAVERTQQQINWMQSFESKVGNMIVIANNSSPSIRSYLGPSIYALIDQFYLAPFGTDFVDLQSILDVVDTSIIERNSTEQSFQAASLQLVSDVYTVHGLVFTAFQTIQRMGIASFQRNAAVWSDSQFEQLSNNCVDLMLRVRGIDWSSHDVHAFTSEGSALVLAANEFIQKNTLRALNARGLNVRLAAM